MNPQEIQKPCECETEIPNFRQIEYSLYLCATGIYHQKRIQFKVLHRPRVPVPTKVPPQMWKILLGSHLRKKTVQGRDAERKCKAWQSW